MIYRELNASLTSGISRVLGMNGTLSGGHNSSQTISRPMGLKYTSLTMISVAVEYSIAIH